MPASRAPRKTKVLIVDDHRTFAQAMALVISMQPDLTARAVLSGGESERAAAEDPPDVVLMDVAMPGRDGVQAAARVIARHPGTRVLVLSAHDDDLLRERALGVGVFGFLSKYEPIDAVLDAVRRAAEGEPMPARPDGSRPRIRDGRRRVPHATERQRSERLSPREREILQLMADGLESPQIVASLGISPATLRTHIQNILTKLGVHSKTQAVLIAVRQGRVTARR